jgi:hypothetical protein
MLTTGNFASAASTLSGGSATINIPAGTLTIGTDTLTVSYTPDSSSASNYKAAVASSSVIVTAQVNPSFTVTGTSVTVAPGATSGNTSIITIAPNAGFKGSVVLTATIASSPAGATASPILTFGSTTPVIITGISAGTATLTIATTAPQGPSCSTAQRTPQNFPWYGGGAILACLLIALPTRRRFSRSLLGMVLLFALLTGVLACSTKSTVCNNVTTAGTTAGSYTVTVTATSGAITETATIPLTVQ